MRSLLLGNVSLFVMLPKEPVPYSLGKEAQAWCGEPRRWKLLEGSKLAFLIVTSVLSPC